MKHKADTTTATTVATTPLADCIGPDMLLGMRRADGWIMVTALRDLAAGGTGYARSAAALAERLTDVLMADETTDLQAV